MKIALLLESLDPHVGDIEAWTCELVTHLVRMKHEVHVVAERFSEAGLAMPVTHHRLRAVRNPLTRADRANRQLQSIGAHLVHDLGIGCSGDVFSSPAGSPVALRQRQLAASPWWTRPWKRFAADHLPACRREVELSRRQLDRSDAIVLACSEMVAADYRSIHGVEEDRIRMLPPGVDIKKYTPHVRKLRRETMRKKLGIEAKELVLLTVADSRQQTAWPLALRALGRLVRKGAAVRLLVLADRPAAPAPKLIARFGVTRHVQVLRQVADRTAYYGAADAVLAPSLYAPFCAATLEGAACGLPCITTRENGAADLLADDGDSFILSRHSAAELADRIELLLDSARRERMGLAARRTAMKHTLQRSIEKAVRIYDEILQDRRQAETRTTTLPISAPSRPSAVARRAA
ncbi:MAG: glycosyltransferase family 4 protein [Thermoguttaceae bacterium]